MDRAVKAGERWTTFIFDGIDCADMGVYSVTNSGTYATPLTASFTDKKTTVTAYDGQYYYGTQITGQKFTMNMFAENLSVKELAKLKAWLSPRHLGKIIFSDQPFKYYMVKPTALSELGAYPLTDIQTPENSVIGDFLEGNIVYTGKFTVTFETVGSAYGYGLSYFRDDLIYDALNYYGSGVYPENYYYDSGLLYKDMCPKMNWNIDADASEQPIPIYNPGDAIAYPKFTVNLDSVAGNGAVISFKNKTTGDSIAVDVHGLSGEIVIDFTEESVICNNMAYYGRMIGNAISIKPKTEVIEIPDTLAQDVEDFYIREYDTIYVEDNIAYINPLALTVQDDWVDNYYFCINYNGGSMITGVDLVNNTLTLDPDVTTYDIPDATEERPAGFECNYLGEYASLDEIESVASKDLGNVAQAQGQWYIYRYDKWDKTNLFSNEEQFKDISGNRVPHYLVFGATLVKMDDLIVSTNNLPAFSMSAEILPRYL